MYYNSLGVTVLTVVDCKAVVRVLYLLLLVLASFSGCIYACTVRVRSGMVRTKLGQICSLGCQIHNST